MVQVLGMCGVFGDYMEGLEFVEILQQFCKISLLSVIFIDEGIKIENNGLRVIFKVNWFENLNIVVWFEDLLV